MSAPKRPNEEGSHSSPLKWPIEETGVFGLTGPREVDKRASLLNRVMPSPGNYLDHPVTACKDARDAKSESRETRSEIRDLYSDPRINLPVVKAESEARLDYRGDPNELRADRAFYNDFKGDAKVERESYTASSSHINWKESIEHHRGKRYSESLVDNLDSWRVARHGLQNTVGVVNLRAEEWDSSEAREAVGENKVDMKGERKKEERHRDTGEREKDRNDRQNNLQLSEATHERKEETQRWERDRKGPQRDKEQNEREMDTGKGKSPSPNEKDSWHQDKDGSVRTFNQDVTASEIKKHKDDSWKVPDREFKDKKRARDTTLGDRHEHQGKSYHKELDDEPAEGEGVTERDRDAFGNGIQQRRRMLRTRGSPQTPHREPQFPSRVRDEGSQGKHEVSTVVYKAGDCMQELLKAWKEFEASQEGKNEETCQNYRTLEIRIPAEYVTSSNRQVRGAQLWGTDIYTNDSDLFAVLMHTGYCRPTSSPPDAIQELRATVRVLPPQEYYTSTLRNNVRSRAWGAGIGCSFRVERCCIVKKGGGTIDLEPRLTHISALEPTLAPVSVERTMTTRSAASNALRQQKFVREVSIQYNLCNEPWLKYSISVVADKGMKKPLYTSARLKKGEVLYLETHSKRYELCFNGEKAAARAHELEQEKRQNHSSHVQNGDRNLAECESTVDVFRWSRCKKILPEEMLLSTGIPLRAEDLEIIEDNLEWEDLQWSQTGVLAAGKMYALARVHFLAPKRK